ncbi:MAG TPA: hypothetical protein VE957_14525 [Terriglobales bacterium]|nr:hypothetical protein [Terriglobales bacterium]
MKLMPIENEPSYSDEQDEEKFIISVLQNVLPERDIKTCEDFEHLAVECCEICHGNYGHYEMKNDRASGRFSSVGLRQREMGNLSREISRTPAAEGSSWLSNTPATSAAGGSHTVLVN